MALSVAVIYGSVRTNRQGTRVVHYLVNQLEARGHEVDFIDAKDENLPMLEKKYQDYADGEAPANMVELQQRLERADAYVVVTGEYNHSIQPGLKNLLDYFMREYFFKPAGIASYSPGMIGGQRAAVHLRAILSELHMVTIPTMFSVPQMSQALDDNGQPQARSLDKKVVRFLDELEWFGEALKEARKRGEPY
jgi:NAD(P)H-dependent FMN reductase